MPNGDDEWARRYPLPGEHPEHDELVALRKVADAARAALQTLDVEFDLDHPDVSEVVNALEEALLALDRLTRD